MNRDAGGPAAGTALAVLLLLVVLAPAGAQVSGSRLVQEVVLDVLVPVDLTKLQLVSACPVSAVPSPGTLAVNPTARSFRWSEADPVAPPQGQPDGMSTKGCGTVSYATTLPVGTTLVRALFNASREVTCPADTIVVNCPNFRQTFRLAGPAGGALEVAYVDPGEEAHAFEPVTTDPPFAPAGSPQVFLNWTFQEPPSNPDPAILPLRPTGAAYASTIQAPTLQAMGVPRPPISIQTVERRTDAAIFEDTVVAVNVAASELEDVRSDLRVRFDPSVAFRELRAPDGAVLTERVTRDAPGPFGFDRSKILLERTPTYTQITVPAEVMRGHGAGTYTLIETQELAAQAAPVLVPLAFILLAAPFPFAFRAARQARSFEREAFGGFRRSARNLRLALLVLLLYYLAVVGAAFLAGGVEQMTRLPVSPTGLFLYLQLALAAGGFAALRRVAGELHRMTVPKEDAR